MIIESPMYGEINTNDLNECIGTGRSYQVYKLDEYKVIKFEDKKMRLVQMLDKPNYNLFNIGKQLNGVPMIPHVYECSNDPNYQIMEYIEGISIAGIDNEHALVRFFYKKLEQRLNYYLDNKFDYENYVSQVDKLFTGCIERGFLPSDLHVDNILIDSKQNVWVVDLDRFKDISKDRHLYYDYKDDRDYKEMLTHGKKIEEFTSDTNNFPKLFQMYIKRRLTYVTKF